MSKLAYYSSFYEALSKMYAIAHYLEADNNYDCQNAVGDLLEVIHMLESNKPIFLKEGEEYEKSQRS